MRKKAVVKRVKNVELFVITAIIAVIMSVLLPCFAMAKDLWKADFRSDNLKMFVPQGQGSQVAIIKDNYSDKKLLQVKFDVECANIGVHIDLPVNLSSNEAKYVYVKYKLVAGPKYRQGEQSTLVCFLQDSLNTSWVSCQQTEMPKKGYAEAAFAKRYFGLAKAVDGKAPEMADIKGLDILINPTADAKYSFTLLISEIRVCSTLPNPRTVAKSRCTMDVSEYASILQKQTENDDFAYQWKSEMIDSQGRMIVDGKPFFPMILYSCMGIDEASAWTKYSGYSGSVTQEATQRRFHDIKEAGFNVLQTYTMQFYGAKVAGPGWENVIQSSTPDKVIEGVLKFMDYANSEGIKAVIGVNQPYSMTGALPEQGREQEWEKRKQTLKANIEALKNHPALVAWYLYDEPTNPAVWKKFPVEDMTMHYQYIKSQDKMHPMVIASCDSTDIQYLRAVDALAVDPYPIDGFFYINTIVDRIDGVDKYQSRSSAMPLVWPVIQICQWSQGKILPNTQEIRLMSLLALTRDIHGLMFYEHKGYSDNDPEQWQNISLAVNSLKSVILDILAAEGKPVLCKSSDSKITAALRKIGGNGGQTAYYSLIAVNSAQNIAFEKISAGKVTINLGKLDISAGSKAVVLDEDESGNFSPGSTRKVELQKNRQGYFLQDNFGGYAAHVYKIGLEN